MGRQKWIAWFSILDQLWQRNDFDLAAVAVEWNALKACVTVNRFRHLDPLVLWQRMFTEF